jgi:heme-degrading monooxygenase HmoA
MHARVTAVDVSAGKINSLVQEYGSSTLAASREQKGYLGALLLMDRDASHGISITLWESEEDMTNGEVSTYYVGQLRKLAQYFAGMPERSAYKVAVFEMPPGEEK